MRSCAACWSSISISSSVSIIIYVLNTCPTIMYGGICALSSFCGSGILETDGCTSSLIGNSTTVSVNFGFISFFGFSEGSSFSFNTAKLEIFLNGTLYCSFFGGSLGAVFPKIFSCVPFGSLALYSGRTIFCGSV